MINMLVVDKRKKEKDEIITKGDIIIYKKINGELAYYKASTINNIMMFINMNNYGNTWKDEGITLAYKNGEHFVSFLDVWKYFESRDIEIVKKENYSITLEIHK